MNPVIPLISQMPSLQQQVWLNLLNQALPEETFVLADTIEHAERRHCEIAIVANPKVETLRSFTHLNWVHSLWAGVDSLLKTGIDQHFKIVRMIDPDLTKAMAEAVLAWTLYIHRKMPTYAAQQKNKIWHPLPYLPANKCTVGILGLGELGLASARELIANGFQVQGWSRHPKTMNGLLAHSGEKGLAQMLKQCQILVCLLPLTEETLGILNKDLLNRLPKGASLINFARGALLVIDDLIEHLKEGKLYHAVLDVFNQEPLETESELWYHPNITVLPHIAAITNPETAVKIVAKNILAYRNRGRLNSVVDFEKGY